MSIGRVVLLGGHKCLLLEVVKAPGIKHNIVKEYFPGRRSM